MERLKISSLFREGIFKLSGYKGNALLLLNRDFSIFTFHSEFETIQSSSLPLYQLVLNPFLIHFLPFKFSHYSEKQTENNPDLHSYATEAHETWNFDFQFFVQQPTPEGIIIHNIYKLK